MLTDMKTDRRQHDGLHLQVPQHQGLEHATLSTQLSVLVTGTQRNQFSKLLFIIFSSFNQLLIHLIIEDLVMEAVLI